MALLSEAKRKQYFSDLGLGNYNKTNIKKFQRTAFSDPKEHDGIYGTKTDIALRHWWNVRHYTKNFSPAFMHQLRKVCTCLASVFLVPFLTVFIGRPPVYGVVGV